MVRDCRQPFAEASEALGYEYFWKLCQEGPERGSATATDITAPRFPCRVSRPVAALVCQADWCVRPDVRVTVWVSTRAGRLAKACFGLPTRCACRAPWAVDAAGGAAGAGGHGGDSGSGDQQIIVSVPRRRRVKWLAQSEFQCSRGRSVIAGQPVAVERRQIAGCKAPRVASAPLQLPSVCRHTGALMKSRLNKLGKDFAGLACGRLRD